MKALSCCDRHLRLRHRLNVWSLTLPIHNPRVWSWRVNSTELEFLVTRLISNIQEIFPSKKILALMQATPQFRNAIHFARQAADRFGHSVLSSGHLIFGLLAVNRGVAGVLRNAGFTAVGVERHLQACSFDRESLDTRDGIAFTQSAAHALIRAEEEATRTGCRFLGTDHVLLALAQEPSGRADDVFDCAKVDRDKVRRLVLERLSTSGPSDLSSFDDLV
jgi:hypothetical protein